MPYPVGYHASSYDAVKRNYSVSEVILLFIMSLSDGRRFGALACGRHKLVMKGP